MTEPLADLGEASREQFVVRVYLATVTAVDATTAVCTINVGDGAPLTGVLYLGPAPVVGRQVAYFTYRRTAFVLGGG